MTFPRVQFTVRRIMLVVAVVAIFAMVVRLRFLTSIYRNRCELHYVAQLHSEALQDRRGAAYHASMLAKYQQATARPWLTVEPDPPEPE